MNNSRIRRLARPLSLIVWLVFFLSSVALLPAQQPRPARRTGNAAPVKESRPRLVLLIVLDQFRYDYLTRFGDLFGSRGIGRLMREGASWTDPNFDHGPTFPASGQAGFKTDGW